MTAATTAIPVPTTHLTRRSPNSHLLIRPFIRREAVLSSRIEGTQSTLTDLLAAEAGARVARDSADLQEVTNYARALDYSVKQLETLPLSLRLKHAQFEAIHPFRDGNGRSVAWRRHSCSSRRRGRSTTHGCSGRPRIRNGETVLRCEYGRRSDGRERGSGRDRRYEAIIKSIVGTGIGLATLLLTLAGPADPAERQCQRPLRRRQRPLRRRQRQRQRPLRRRQRPHR